MGLFSKKKSKAFFEKKQRGVQRVSWSRKQKKADRFPRSVLFLTLWICFMSLIGVFVWWMRQTIFGDHQYIKNVDIDQSARDMIAYDDVYLDAIAMFSGDHYLWRVWFPYDDLSTLTQRYPFVDTWHVQQWASVQDITLAFSFVEPDFRLTDGQDIWVSYIDERLLLPLASGNRLWERSLLVELPQYASGMVDIQWVFYGVPPWVLYHDYLAMQEYFGDISRFVFLVWWQKSVLIREWGQRLSISHTKPIQDQITAYAYAQQRVSDSYQVDLASLDHIIAE